MEVCHVESAVFDDPNLVSCAGLGPVVALAEQCGLPQLVAAQLTLPAKAGVNAHLKVPALVGAMVAGATTGPSPAQDTKFGSSNTADSTWQTSIPRVPFCPVGCDYRSVSYTHLTLPTKRIV